jgi:hypothetical protein
VSDEKQLPTEALAKLRVPFESNHIAQKPVPTKKQTDEVRSGTVRAEYCEKCGGYHHPNAQHLSYVGHAAITHRLLDVDPLWSWEPVAFDAKGLPAIDGEGGLWIRLTVCGVTRLGYGDAQGKSGPDAMKERIGDALRNAGMRFGMALELWHKGVLEMEPERFEPDPADKWVMKAGAAATLAELETCWTEGAKDLIEKNDRAAYDEFKAAVKARKGELQSAEGA